MNRMRPFRFKQFSVRQQQSAMKVGFDGVLLGAWANITACKRIVDVGSGTGLIALMLAQRTADQGLTTIDAVEIDEKAYAESLQNAADSPWCNRIACHHRRIQEFGAANEEAFNHAVCNPPFFDADARGQSNDEETPRMIARHSTRLTLAELFESSSRIVSDAGRLSLILPIARAASAVAIAAENRLHCSRRTDVKPNPSADAKRVLMEFRRTAVSIESNSITIETETRHAYSEEFIALTREFYLKM